MLELISLIGLVAERGAQGVIGIALRGLPAGRVGRVTRILVRAADGILELLLNLANGSFLAAVQRGVVLHRLLKGQRIAREYRCVL